MRDPYLYDGTDTLINNGNIKSNYELKEAEASLTKFTMAIVYTSFFEKFNQDTLCEINKIIFGDLYPWAGEYRTIQIAKFEEVLGGGTVRYAPPNLINSQLKNIAKEIEKLYKLHCNKEDLIVKIARITAKIWEIHPFREGNTRTTVVFSVLLAQKLGLHVNYKLFEKHSAYVRNSFVWASQGIYSKFEYLEQIYLDAMGGKINNTKITPSNNFKKYETINGYEVKNYKESPHIYIDKND